MAQLSSKQGDYLQKPASSASDFLRLFHSAVLENNVSLVKLLLNTLDLDLNKPGQDGFYPLHHGAASGSLECVEFLVQMGAEVDVYQRGISPLDLAVLEGEFDCAKFLIQCGANIKNIRNGFSNIRLYYEKYQMKEAISQR